MTKLAFIRIVGRVDITPKVKTTLELLRLRRVNNCVVHAETSTLRGMIKHIKDFVTYGEIDEKTFVELFKKRARKGRGKPIDEAYIKTLKAKNIEELAKRIYNDSIKITETNISPVFRLHPPVKGFEREGRKTFKEAGKLGYRGEKINELIRRMI